MTRKLSGILPLSTVVLGLGSYSMITAADLQSLMTGRCLRYEARAGLPSKLT